MGISGYTSLSIHQERFKKIRKGYEKVIKPETNDTLTSWATRILELNLSRMDYLKKTFPNLSIIKATKNELIVEDSEKDIVTKIIMSEGKITCSHKGNESDSYILYVTLHPQFHLV